MPYKRKDSPTWWVSFTDPSGKRVRRTTGTEDRKEAEALEAKWKLEAYRQQQWDEQPSRSFDELLLQYLKSTANEKRSADRDLCSAKHLKRFFSGKELGTLQAVDVRAYIEQRKSSGASAGTINRELGLFSSAINNARKEWDWDIPNPVQGRRLREPEGRVRWLTRAEAQALLRSAGEVKQAEHLPSFIQLALHTGCRRGELLGLEWRRVDLQAGLIHLEAEHTKSGKRRSVPINALARESLKNRLRFRAKYCPNTPWVFCNRKGERIQSVKHSFAAACRKAGITNFRVHDLRHTCAAWLVTAGVPLTETRDLLGHSTVRMTERYAHLAPENIRAAVTRLEGSQSRFGHAVENDTTSKAV